MGIDGKKALHEACAEHRKSGGDNVTEAAFASGWLAHSRLIRESTRPASVQDVERLVRFLAGFSWQEPDDEGETCQRDLKRELRWNDDSLDGPDARFYALAQGILALTPSQANREREKVRAFYLKCCETIQGVSKTNKELSIKCRDENQENGYIGFNGRSLGLDDALFLIGDIYRSEHANCPPAPVGEVERVGLDETVLLHHAGSLYRIAHGPTKGVIPRIEEYLRHVLTRVTACTPTPSLTPEQREAIRTEIQSHPILLHPTKQLRQMLKDKHRPVSVYHSEETASEVAEDVIAAIERTGGK